MNYTTHGTIQHSLLKVDIGNGIPIQMTQGNVVGSSRTWRGPFTFRSAKANSMHRVELEPRCYTLDYFYSGKKKKDWGFVIPKYVYDKTLGMDVINYTWVDHKTHLGDNV